MTVPDPRAALRADSPGEALAVFVGWRATLKPKERIFVTMRYQHHRLSNGVREAIAKTLTEYSHGTNERSE